MTDFPPVEPDRAEDGGGPVRSACVYPLCCVGVPSLFLVTLFVVWLLGGFDFLSDPRSPRNAKPFHAEEWHTGGESTRNAMFTDLVESQQLLGLDRAALEDRLGEPTLRLPGRTNTGAPDDGAERLWYYGPSERLVLMVSLRDGIVTHVSILEPDNS